MSPRKTAGRICQQCGKIFFAEPAQVRLGYAKYCSKECFGKSCRTGEYRTCEKCGAQFYMQPNQLRRGGGKYCSRECRLNKVTRECEVCSIEFDVKRCHVDAGKGRYCSFECYWASLRNGELLKCKVCDKEFYANASRISYGREHCSKECTFVSSSEAAKERWANGVYDGVFRSPTTIEIAMADALNELGVEYEQEWRPNGYSRIFDFFIAPNLLIEMQGDYWHTRPEVVEKDTDKASWAEENGYQLIPIWEYEIKDRNAIELVVERIGQFIELGGNDRALDL